MCRREHDRLMRVPDICQDDAQVLALSILRFVASGYMTGDVACWDAAHDAAERVLGPVEGAQLVAAMTGIMRAIRRERGDDWRFMPATCCRVTADESCLIELIGCARHGCRADLQEKAADLIGLGAAPCLCASVLAAAERIDAVQFRLAPHRPLAAGAVIH